jgi:simple sugar transport system substrate-binding protein
MRHAARIFAALAVAGALALAGRPAVAKDINIVVITHGQASDPFWSVVKNGAVEAAKEAGVNVTYRAPETFDMVAMGQLITAAANQRPDGMVVSIPDADALGQPIKAAVAAGIPVISMNSGLSVSKKLGALMHVGQEEYAAGKAAGERLAALGGKKGVCINQEVGNVALDDRCKGFSDGFGKPAKVLPTTMDPSDTQSKVRALMQSDPSVDTILTCGAPTVGEPTVAAIKAMGLTGKVRIGSFDLSATYLKSVAAGDAVFAIDQQPYLQGALPVMFLAYYARDGLIPSGNVASGPNFITKDKAQQVIQLSSQGIR